MEMFSQVVDISPYLVRDFIMKEAQTQEEVGALCLLKVSFLLSVFGSSLGFIWTCGYRLQLTIFFSLASSVVDFMVGKQF